MTNKPVTDSLKKVLADSYALYLKTQNYHWNVQGPNFKTLHLLFEEQYIRALGEKAPGTWKAYEAVSTIKDGDENADATTMVSELANDQEVLLATLKHSLEAAQTAGDEVTVGLVVDRMSVHEKAAWMLKSSL